MKKIPKITFGLSAAFLMLQIPVQALIATHLSAISATAIGLLSLSIGLVMFGLGLLSLWKTRATLKSTEEAEANKSLDDEIWSDSSPSFSPKQCERDQARFEGKTKKLLDIQHFNQSVKHSKTYWGIASLAVLLCLMATPLLLASQGLSLSWLAQNHIILLGVLPLVALTTITQLGVIKPLNIADTHLYQPVPTNDPDEMPRRGKKALIQGALITALTWNEKEL